MTPLNRLIVFWQGLGKNPAKDCLEKEHRFFVLKHKPCRSGGVGGGWPVLFQNTQTFFHSLFTALGVFWLKTRKPN